MRRASRTRALLERMLELRDNFSAYDATCVALAERIGAFVLTTDERLGRAVLEHANVVTAEIGRRPQGWVLPRHQATSTLTSRPLAAGDVNLHVSFGT